MIHNYVLKMCFLIFGFSLSAQAAYFQADLSANNDDVSMGTHIIIVGKGIEVGDLWLPIAHAQALTFKDKKNHGPIKMIAAIDKPDTFNKKLSDWGYRNVKVYNKTMTGTDIVNMIGQNEKISSIDFIGHNGAFLGFALEGYDYRMFLKHVDLMKSFKHKFTKDSYIRILGCNTGWSLAPYMAEQLGVPTAGTFTSADIQILMNDNQWYIDVTSLQPKGASRIKTNTNDFSEPLNCTYGAGCVRLKTIPIQYSGKRGSYKGTVPFLKYFCGSVNSDDCARRAALSVLTNFGQSAGTDNQLTIDNYSTAVSDIMCVAWKDHNAYRDCLTKVKVHMKGNISLPKTYTTALSPMLVCNFKKCETKSRWDGANNIMEGIFTKPSTTFVDELDFYKRGFELIK